MYFTPKVIVLFVVYARICLFPSFGWGGVVASLSLAFYFFFQMETQKIGGWTTYTTASPAIVQQSFSLVFGLNNFLDLSFLKKIVYFFNIGP